MYTNSDSQPPALALKPLGVFIRLGSDSPASERLALREIAATFGEPSEETAADIAELFRRARSTRPDRHRRTLEYRRGGVTIMIDLPPKIATPFGIRLPSRCGSPVRMRPVARRVRRARRTDTRRARAPARPDDPEPLPALSRLLLFLRARFDGSSETLDQTEAS